MLRGSCLCKGVAYEITGEPELIVNCHCLRCRKASSAAHGSNLFVAPGKFRWLRGEELLVSYKVLAAKRFRTCFCRVCGSRLPPPSPYLDRVTVPAGSLDNDPGARERLHIFCSSKAPWFEITDRLPQFDEYPPAAK